MSCALISVVVPVYKAEKYIDECIESIVNQTYRNLEIILVDDGSPDRCPKICDEWAFRDERIKVIHQTNKGAAAARNAGIKVASGQYIGFVDSDDYIDKTMYEVLYEGIGKSDAQISCCYFVREYGNGADSTEYTFNEKKYEPHEALNAFFAGKEISSSACDKLFDRSLFENISFPEGETNEEYPILIPLFIGAGGVYHCARMFYFYRNTPDSVTRSMWKDDGNVVYKHLCEMHDQLNEYGLKEKCGKFALFCGKSAFSIALHIDKNHYRANENAKKNQIKYLSIMKKTMLICLLSRDFLVKDKILYIMVLFRFLRPVYKMLGRL